MLVPRSSRIVALVVSSLQNQFFPQVAQTISQQLQRNGYRVLLFIEEIDEAADGVLSEILQYEVDGIVTVSAMISETLAHSLTQIGIPIVQFGRVSTPDATSSQFMSTVTCNNYLGGAMVADLLIQRGYRRLAYLAGLEDSSTSIDRERGFRDRLNALGFSLHRREVGHYDFERAQAAIRRMFSDREPDAVFAANDHMAIAAMDVLRLELGLNIPEQVGLVGFDDMALASLGSYRLTTVHQQIDLMAQKTAELLCEQIRDAASPRNIVFPCVIVERDTVRRLPEER